METSFKQLGLASPIVDALEQKGYRTPTPIQQKAIPAIIDGKDVLAAAQTGTGKTAAFTLPLMHQLSQQKVNKKGRKVRALILIPTRELAAQIEENISLYGINLPLKCAVVFGGVKINPQITKLKAGVDILIATPGRLLDLCDQGHCDLSQVNFFVLDEADRMLDMGFIHEMRKVVKLLPKQRQNLLFSATFSKEIRILTREFLVNPEVIEVAGKNTTAQTVKQRAYRCDATCKTNLTVKLISAGKWEQVLIFTRTKHGADRLTKHLRASVIKAAAIHGDKSQNARVKALEDFKDKKIRVLVATDIAARGIDISQLPHVINYEIPNVPEDYVHRIGRTGRAGQEGEAISLVCNDERAFFKAIESLTKQKIPFEDIKGFEPEEWSARMPTANEVQKARDERRKLAMQARGGRKPQGPSKPKGKKKAKSQHRANSKGQESQVSSVKSAKKKSSSKRRFRGKRKSSTPKKSSN